ncbi:serine hydrolase [Frateuria terrea]|uniref:CubicO group peptidase, beta-lactamase class C family n=1 Tax=Frateuria terrea TaxID=529704 RepID=A0A1H6U635_9GAMM|nr:serine hydrolase [Frateuria terrea]SEI86014.1 CubicO group peptidase, beta-lactamase class C family [Frateuria terrea]SFP39079.1 CubicO group peptidase, beta-lactamase class C family [Frateuria terrea]
MIQPVLSVRLAAACAWLFASTGVLAQTPVQRPLPPPVSTGDTARPLPPSQLADFGAYVDSARKTFDVPGIAVAIVKDGHVVMEQGWGLRELGKSDKVDAHTLFAIASNTKAFTAAAMQQLAEQGKLDMDDRVIEHLPWFRMSDAYVTHEMRIRDLLAHRSGLSLGAGDLLYWPPTSYTTKDVVERLAKVPIKNSFRAGYAYDNILFAVATLVIEQASGQSYADYVREHIFKPVGMDESLIDKTYLKPGMDVATGHAKADFKDLKPVPPMAWLNDPGAGGIYSSVHDMAKWMNVQLAGGELPTTGADGKPRRLFSEKSQHQMWSMLTPIQINKPPVPELAPLTPDFFGYGESWFLSDYQGKKLVWHTGGWPGMVTRVTLVPELKLGVVVLTNAESGAAFNAVTYRVLDAYLNPGKKTDWVAVYDKAVKHAQAKADDSMAKHQAARDKNSRPSLPLAGYAGTYRDPWYGDVVVSREGGKLRMRFSHTPQLVGTMTPWQHDTFTVRWDDRTLNADAFVTFALDQDGHVREARMEPISPLTDFSFDFQDLRLAPVLKEHDGSSD